MRNIVLAITAGLTIGFASALLPVGVATPSYAQATQTPQQRMAAMKAANPKSFDACWELARKRGFVSMPEQDTRDAHGIMMFV